MIRSLGKILNVRFKQLSVEPQLAGAIGAAVFAMKEENNCNG
jgi:activator of 2-hydroxyglutaryl-CoA dehydratase